MVSTVPIFGSVAEPLPLIVSTMVFSMLIDSVVLKRLADGTADPD